MTPPIRPIPPYESAGSGEIGSVDPRDGSIYVNSELPCGSSRLVYGQVVVTAVQAVQASAYGWRVIEAAAGPGLMVIERIPRPFYRR